MQVMSNANLLLDSFTWFVANAFDVRRSLTRILARFDADQQFPASAETRFSLALHVSRPANLCSKFHGIFSPGRSTTGPGADQSSPTLFRDIISRQKANQEVIDSPYSALARAKMWCAW